MKHDEEYELDKVTVDAHLDQLIQMVKDLSAAGATELQMMDAFITIITTQEPDGGKLLSKVIGSLWTSLLRLSKRETVVPYNDDAVAQGQHMPGVKAPADVPTLYEELHHIRRFWADTNDSLKSLTDIMNQRGDLIAAAAGQALARLHDLATRGDVLMRKYEQAVDERLASRDEQPTA